VIIAQNSQKHWHSKTGGPILFQAGLFFLTFCVHENATKRPVSRRPGCYMGDTAAEFVAGLNTGSDKSVIVHTQLQIGQ
jgi:hypothetical protein